MNPKRKASTFLTTIAALLIIVGGIIATTQSAHADDCRTGNASNELTTKIRNDIYRTDDRPPVETCGVRTVTWALLAVGGLLAVAGVTMWLATAPTTPGARAPVVEKERQYRRIT